MGGEEHFITIRNTVFSHADRRICENEMGPPPFVTKGKTKIGSCSNKGPKVHFSLQRTHSKSYNHNRSQSAFLFK